MISGVYDHVPQDTAYPFVVIGQDEIRDLSNLEKEGTEHRLSFRIYSREAGRKEASSIMERIVALMHTDALTITGQTILASRFTSSNIALEKDGATYTGTLNFRVVMVSEG